MQALNEDVFHFLDQEPEWTFSHGMCMNGLIDVSRVTGDQEYKRGVLDFMRNSVSPEGTILPAPASMTDLAACGKALFFALDETGEERFRKALDAVASEVNMAPLPDTPKGLYAIAPFLAEYDTRFGGKQAYKAIAEHFKAVHQKLFDRKTGLYCTDVSRFSILNEGFMLMALADTAEKLDIQIYEHYRTVADLLLQAVRMPYRLGTDRLFTILCGDSEKKPDYTGLVMLVYAMYKGIRLQILDPEKYLPLARAGRKLPVPPEAFGFPCDPGLWMMLNVEAEGVERA